MRAITLLWALGAATGLAAQNVVTFPADYANVPEGPYWSESLPFAYGTSRVMTIYDAWDITVPSGARILRIGFRQDGQVTQMDVGRSLQLEVRMGYAGSPASLANSVFDQNYAGQSTGVFGPAVFTLPNLRDPASPLPGNVFWLTLTTPFTYTPANGNLIVEYRVFGNSAGGASFPYYLDRAWVHSPHTVGAPGCPHSGSAVPVLDATPAAVGYQFYYELRQAPANNLAVLLLTPMGRIVQPYSLQPVLPGIAASCLGQLPLTQPLSLITFADNGGYAYWYLTPPPRLVPFNDMWVGAQALCFDFFAPGGVVVSNGLDLQIGAEPSCNQIYAQGPPLSQVNGSVYYGYCPVALFDYQ